MTDLRVECTECGYQWTLCDLPVEVSALSDLVAGAICVQCGADSNRIGFLPSVGGEAVS